MVKNGDIFGDGVNVAARLQTLATAGGICVSRGVRDNIRHLAGFSFEDLGEQVVKNIARPVRAFRVTIDPEAAAEAPEETAPPQPPGIPSDSRAAESTALDLAMWETVSDSNDVEAFLHYLERFPEGEFAEIARNRITALSQAPSEMPQNRSACRGRRHRGRAELLGEREGQRQPRYVRGLSQKYPNGEFVPLAKVRLEELRQ